MEQDIFKHRAILYFFCLCAIILVVKAASLQVLDNKYQEKASKTAVNKEWLYPSRGLLFDRNGKLLVHNTPLYDIEVVYNQLSETLDTSFLCELLQIDKSYFEKNIEKNWKARRYNKSVPYVFMSRVKPEIVNQFEEHIDEFSGFKTILRNIRSYPHQNAAHVLGYLGEVNQKTIDQSKGEYLLGDYIGVSGVEKTYEHNLRGQKGVKFTLKDNLGREVNDFQEGKLDTTAVSGTDMISALDLELQQYGEVLMQNKRGSIVAIEPETGEILSMISSPGFDPNIFNLDRDRGESLKFLQEDTINRSSVDRTVMAQYPPGSIFKPIFSLIALQEGITYPRRTIKCDGSYEVNTKGFSMGCHAHPTAYNISIAIEHSCNAYYYQLMREFLNKEGYTTPGLALQDLLDYLYKFGLGRRLGVDHTNERSGFLPTPKYYDDLYKRWRSTYVLSIGIGQGELELTTVQMANLAAILANRGYFYTPHIIKGFADKNLQIDQKYRERKEVGIDSVYFPYIIDGMEKAMLTGTAQLGYVPGLDICGKTGTSQNPHGKDHSVFFGFAPKENPKIAIAVYVENAGFGGEIAAPIASLMMEKYLTNNVSDRRKWLDERMKKIDLITNP